jgi:ricin-type beta-trefoil lectin protein/CHAP domain-containing protein
VQLQSRARQAPYNKPSRRYDKDDDSHHGLILAIALIIGFVWLFSFMNLRAHAATAEIKSGLSGQCLDDYKGLTGANSVVDAWGCNDTVAQAWTASTTTITHNNNCLSVKNDGTTVGDHVVLNACNNQPGQVWLRDQGGYKNPNSGMCLAVPNQTDSYLEIAPCSHLSKANEQWSPLTAKGSSYVDSCNSGSEGQRVACYAVKEWTTWQTGSPNHNDLLNQYSDGNGYEEWCADFVSYVYQEAGYPFSQGERNGWDEYNANNIQNMGFTYHDATSYSPQPGDVAYFDYSGGHVEIVVSGGAVPTFVYGDSGTIDPVTGNGQMEANTILSDGSFGQVMYYLSPN